jgi:hypothetical protein
MSEAEGSNVGKAKDGKKDKFTHLIHAPILSQGRRTQNVFTIASLLGERYA